MPLIEIDWNPSPERLRRFALALPLAALLPAGLIYWQTHSLTAGLSLPVLCSAASVVGLWRPAWIRPIYRGWLLLGIPIRWVLSHVILLLLYFGLLTPLGLILRALGYDPLSRSLDRRAATYWSKRDELRDVRRYFRQH